MPHKRLKRSTMAVRLHTKRKPLQITTTLFKHINLNNLNYNNGTRSQQGTTKIYVRFLGEFHLEFGGTGRDKTWS